MSDRNALRMLAAIPAAARSEQTRTALVLAATGFLASIVHDLRFDDPMGTYRSSRWIRQTRNDLFALAAALRDVAIVGGVTLCDEADEVRTPGVSTLIARLEGLGTAFVSALEAVPQYGSDPFRKPDGSPAFIAEPIPVEPGVLLGKIVGAELPVARWDAWRAWLMDVEQRVMAQVEISDPEAITVQRLAEIVGCDPKTITRELKSAKAYPSEPIRKGQRLRRSAVEKLIERANQKGGEWPARARLWEAELARVRHG